MKFKNLDQEIPLIKISDTFFENTTDYIFNITTSKNWDAFLEDLHDIQETISFGEDFIEVYIDFEPSDYVETFIITPVVESTNPNLEVSNLKIKDLISLVVDQAWDIFYDYF